jgi:hypothetical protein
MPDSIPADRTDMLDSITIRTNNVPRDIIDAWELSADERAEFDYIDWPAVDDGRESASFFRYRGELYDLGEFSADYGITRGAGLPAHLSRWDAYQSDTFFSATVIRYCDDFERVVVGRVFS